MNKDLLKKGVNKLFTAELLTIISGFVGAVSDKLWFLAIPLALCSIVGYFLALNALKDCANADENFKKARTFALVGLVSGILTIVSAIFSQVSIFESLIVITTALEDLCELFVTIYILTAMCSVLDDFGRYELARRASVVKILFLIGWALAQFMILLGGNKAVSAVISGVIAGTLSVAFLIVAELMYILFLDQARKAL